MEAIFFLIPMFFVVFFGIIVAVVLKMVKESRNKKTQDEYAARYRENGSTSQVKQPHHGSTMTDEQRRRLDYLREQQRQRIEADQRHERHQQDAHEHAHMGEEEHYEEIIGSLGDVSDEGCEDLSGVRFIVHDLAYDTSDDEQPDYTRLAQAMVLGEIINNPRFKGLKRL